jgi:propanol-preferring alcohol dehydrogenase
MVLQRPGDALMARELPIPSPKKGEILVRVSCCGVCRTDLHIVDGELPAPRLPLVPGHEIVGTVEATGQGVSEPRTGERVGIPWLASTCGTCGFCLAGKQNLCERAAFTGYSKDGGYAEYLVADVAAALSVPEAYGDVEAAPLLCAGLIGYRAYRAAGDGKRLGLFGFGAAAHLLAQLATAEARDVYAFTRDGDLEGQAFARSLGALWAGGSGEAPPTPLDAAIIFAPVGALVPAALAAVRPGGTVVCAGIHMSEIPAFPYDLLWRERVLRSVANLTWEDGRLFMEAASRASIGAVTETLPLADANLALSRLREGKVKGALVLVP